MKQQLFFFLLMCSAVTFSQIFSTETVTVGSLSASVRIDDTTTTVTMMGPEDNWFAVGFRDAGSTTGNMSSGADVLRTDGTTLTDAQFSGFGLPGADTSQDWTLDSNTVSGGVRTVVASRANNSGDANDFVFSPEEAGITLVLAHGTLNGTTHAQHSSRGAVAAQTLSTKKYQQLSFGLYPVPASNSVTVQLPTNVSKAEVSVFDLAGRLVANQAISLSDKDINIQALGAGMYMVKVMSEDKLGVKRLVKK